MGKRVAGAHLSLLSLLTLCSFGSCQDQPLVPAMFIFGDSLVDDGNNNYIPSLARSNFAPYGIDFPLGPTGRFCNGRTVLDALGQRLGLPFLPAYLNPATRGPAILRGVNYASGAGGILDASGANYIARLSFNTQILYFQNTLVDITNQLGGRAPTAQYLSKSLFTIVLGSNDYLNNYLMSRSRYNKQYTPPAYQTLVLQTFAKQLVTLYELGARRFLVSGVGPLGCIPNQLATKSKDGKCVKYINDLVVNFNAGLKGLLQELNSYPPLVGATFLYGNVYDGLTRILESPGQYGFSVTDTGCCGVGKNRGQLTCLPPLAQLCPDRNKHVFWDAFHPTDAVNVILARNLFEGTPSDVSPINVLQLVQQ